MYRRPPTPDQQAPGQARGPEGLPGPPSDREGLCAWAHAGPGGWAEGCGGLGDLPPPATPDPAALAERGLPPDPILCSGPHGPGGVGLQGPPPPDPCGPGTSEHPAGLGAVKLECPTCPAPAQCPNPPEATGAWSTGVPQPRPFTLPRPPFSPTPPAKHSTFLREQMSHRQAHRQTHRHWHAPTPRETAGLRKLLSQSQSTWQRPGPDERAGGRLSGDTEAEIHEDSETDSKTARGDTHTHTHTHILECGLWKYFYS